MSESPTISENVGSKRKRSSTSGRSKYGCLTCRTKKVKCDEQLPSCGRCDRLKLICQQPCSRILPSVRERRRGAGPLKSRDPDWAPQSLSPAVHRSGKQTQDPEALIDHYLSGFDHGLAAAASPSFSVQNSVTIPQVQAPVTETEGGLMLDPAVEWLLPDPQSMNIYTSSNNTSPSIDLEQFHIANISPVQKTLPENGIRLNRDEDLALTHYRTIFSPSQTTRDPQWSTPALLLLHGLNNSQMLLHLILAVSLHDMPPTNLSREIGHKHYEQGTEQLMQALQHENFVEHLAVLASFFCIHMYMLRSSGAILSKLDRLSLTATEYLNKYQLTIYTHEQSPSTGQDWTKNRAERSLIARVIMWLLKMDAQASFLGCKPSLVEHFEVHPEQLSAVQAESRLALQLNWGAEYPISQSIRDIESCLPVDMMTDMLLLCCKISKFSQIPLNPDTSAMLRSLQNELAALETRYGTVFYYGSSDMTLQPAMKLNCANSATTFYALQIYLIRSGASLFGSDSSPEIKATLSQLLLFAMHVCPAGSQQPVYEFQWALFIAAIETNDMIHQEWLQGRISDHRLCEALQRISSFKRDNQGTISLSKVREIIQAV
ncbi:hypothetical protein MFRU_006g01330 [Monilinia fructicola]|nr:hypothetical protein MFRU_006g01330 [Monilinia fructicola]